MKFLKFGLMLASVAALATGCSLSPEANSTEDKDRLGAVEFKVNDLVLDFVSCLEGDKTDWKYFNVPYESDMVLAFAFDEPTAGGKIVMYKATGEEFYTRRFSPGARNIQEFHALPGHYYLEITCETFESEYTLEITYK